MSISDAAASGRRITQVMFLRKFYIHVHRTARNNVIVEISFKNNTQNIQTLDVNFAEHSNIL